MGKLVPIIVKQEENLPLLESSMVSGLETERVEGSDQCLRIKSRQNASPNERRNK